MATLRQRQLKKKSAVLNVPNILTAIRMTLAPVVVYYLMQGGFSLLHAALVFTVAALTDYFDGQIARRQHRVTMFGTFMDPLADKVLMVSVFGSFVLMGLMPMWVLATMIVRDLVVTGLRLSLLTKNLHVITSKFGKWKTTMQFLSVYFFMGYAFLQVLPNNVVAQHLLADIQSLHLLGAMYLGLSGVTVLSGVHYIKRNYSQIRRLFVRPAAN